MIGRFVYDTTAAAVGTVIALLIFTGWLIWHKRATMLLVFALGAAAALALSGCSAGRIAVDALRDGVVR